MVSVPLPDWKDAVAEPRRSDPSVRAIVASGYSSDPVLAGFRAYGFCGALRKPFTLDDLRRGIGGPSKPTEV